MTRGVQIVRLLAAVVISLAACTFAIAYNHVSADRYTFDHPGAGRKMTDFNDFVSTRGHLACIVPCVAFVVGIVAILRWPKLPVIIELIVSALWISAFIWVGLNLIFWQLENIPLIMHMQTFY